MLMVGKFRPVLTIAEIAVDGTQTGSGGLL